jgi:hypothetical protein
LPTAGFMTRTHGHGCLRIGFAKATDRWGRGLFARRWPWQDRL